MEKTIQKIKNLFWFQLLSIVIVVGIIPIALFIPIVWLKIVAIMLLSGITIFLICYTYSKAKKLEKQLQKEIQEYNDSKKKTTLLDIYGILGIPPQYKPDGSLKDIFDLLGIEPKYDENGRRIATVYERLGINPRFTLDGLEIPFVFRIKNRVNTLLRASASVPLFYVPRDALLMGIRPYPVQPLPPEMDGKPKEEQPKKPFVQLKAKTPGQNKPKIENPKFAIRPKPYKEQKPIVWTTNKNQAKGSANKPIKTAESKQPETEQTTSPTTKTTPITHHNRLPDKKSYVGPQIAPEYDDDGIAQADDFVNVSFNNENQTNLSYNKTPEAQEVPLTDKEKRPINLQPGTNELEH